MRLGVRFKRSAPWLILTTALFLALMGNMVWATRVALAQEPLKLKRMTVALWPEYDKPGVLVIYRGELTADVALPVRLTFGVPASSGGPSSAAGVDEGGQFRYRRWDITSEGDQLLATFELPYRRFQFEYYYDPFAGQGVERSFEYEYRADYAVESFALEIQEPAGSSVFSIDPAASERRAEAGLAVHAIDLGALAAGDEASVKVAYHKDDAHLTTEQLGLPGPNSVQFEDAPATPGSSGNQTLFIVVGLVVTMAAVVGMSLWVRSRQSAVPAKAASVRPQGGGKPRSKSSRKKAARANAERAARSAVKPAAPDATVVGYCHRCGRPLKADERFCPSCGTPRKRDSA